jgi:subtilisin-like proprotein convertase family protein
LSDNETYTTPSQTLASCNTVVRAEVTSVWSPVHTFAGDLVLSVRSPGSAPTFFIYRDSVGGSDDYFGETTVLTTTTIIGRSGNGPWEWRAFDDAIIDTGTIQSVTLRVWCR